MINGIKKATNEPYILNVRWAGKHARVASLYTFDGSTKPRINNGKQIPNDINLYEKKWNILIKLKDFFYHIVIIL
jgi:hypothetical protein